MAPASAALSTTEVSNVAGALPDEFVTIPATTLASGKIEPAFQVGKYLCSRDAGGGLAVTVVGLPAARVSYFEAVEACKAAGFALLTLSQSQAIAINIATVAANWSGGLVGQGSLKQGLRDWSVSSAQPGSYFPEDPTQSRQFLLPNGEVIIDAAGHLFTWLFDDIQGDERGVVARPFDADSPAVAGAPFPSMKNGMGWYPGAGANWSGFALFRGGFFRSGDYAGVFGLYSGSPGYRDDFVGFRCTKPSSGL